MKIFLSLVFVVWGNLAFSQVVGFALRVINFTTEKKEVGAVVKVYEGSTVLTTQTVNNKGEIILELPYSKNLKVEISKPGMVTRFFLINTNGINDELTQAGVTGEAEVKLFKQEPSVDYSYIETKEITTFNYKSGEELIYDAQKSQAMSAKIEEIVNGAAKKATEDEAKYNQLMSEAEGLTTLKKYNDAIDKLEAAQLLKPKEPIPAQKIAQLETLLKAANASAEQAEKSNNDYLLLIKSADQFRDLKKYDDAITKYNDALTKKSEQYAVDQIKFCQDAKTNALNEADKQAKYEAAMDLGNTFFGQKSYPSAKKKYLEALNAKPDDPIATKKLEEIASKENAQKAEQDKKKLYNDAILVADELFSAEKWQESVVKYKEAKGIESGSSYADEKIAEATKKIEEINQSEAKKTQIAKLLTEGEQAFGEKKWILALGKYDEVLKLDPENGIAKTQRVLINSKIEEENQNAQKIADAKKVSLEGDALAKTLKWKDAKAKYEAAQIIYDDPSVKLKIDEMQIKIDAENNKAINAEKFASSIAEGDALVLTNEFDSAIEKYNFAKTLDPISKVPAEKIASASKKKTEFVASNEKQEKYKQAFEAGEVAQNTGDLSQSLSKFKEASLIDVTKKEAKDKVLEITKLIQEKTDIETKNKTYFDLIKAGVDLQAANKYNEAKAKYVQAQKLDNSLPDAATKIIEIDGLIAESTKIAQLNKLITDGSNALDKKDYALAKSKLNDAKQLDPTNTIIDEKLKLVSEAENALSNEAEKKKKVNELIGLGNTAFAKSDFNAAIGSFNEALLIDPLNAEAAKRKIDTQNKMDELSAANQKSEQFKQLLSEGKEALKNENLTSAKEKFTKATQLDQSNVEAKDLLNAVIKAENEKLGAEQKKITVSKLIQQAKDKLAADKLIEAKTIISEALFIDNNDSEAKELLTQINEKISIAEENSKKSKDYTAFISEGDALKVERKYTEAIEKYSKAQLIDASKPEAQIKINEVNQLLEADINNTKISNLLEKANTSFKAKEWEKAKSTYQEVLNLDAQNSLAKSGIRLVDEALMASKSNPEFDAAVKKGDGLVAEQKYLEASKAYETALILKQDPFVQSKYDQAISNAKTQNEEGLRAYTNILNAGQKAIENKDYVKAKDYFTRAKDTRKNFDGKENDPLPDEKLAEIANLEIILAGENAILLAYSKQITEAESFVTAKKYTDAISSFEKAKVIKSDESTPSIRIAEIQSLLNGENTNKLLEEKYAKAMANGASEELKKNYNQAISFYEQGLDLKPDDLIATAKINALRQKMEAEKNTSVAVDELLKKADGMYNLYISTEDAENLANTKKAYLQVIDVDQNNQHAQQRINELADKIGSISGEDMAYKSMISKADGFFENKKYEKAKKVYEQIIKITKEKTKHVYPIQRLKEIDNILNPKAIAEVPVQVPVVEKEPTLMAYELSDPGEKTSFTEEENQQRLIAAQLAREQLKADRVREKESETSALQGQNANNAKMSANESNELLDETITLIAVETNFNNVEGTENLDLIDVENEARKEMDAENNTKVSFTTETTVDQIDLVQEQVKMENQSLTSTSDENTNTIKANDEAYVELNRTDAENKRILGENTVESFDKEDERVEEVNTLLNKNRDENAQEMIQNYDQTIEVEKARIFENDQVVEGTSLKYDEIQNDIKLSRSEENIESTVNGLIVGEFVSQDQIASNETNQFTSEVSVFNKGQITDVEQQIGDANEKSQTFLFDNSMTLIETNAKVQEVKRVEYNNNVQMSNENNLSIDNELTKKMYADQLPSLIAAEQANAVALMTETSNEIQKEEREMNEFTSTSNTIILGFKTDSLNAPLQIDNNNHVLIDVNQTSLNVKDKELSKAQNASSKDAQKLLSSPVKTTSNAGPGANQLGKDYPEGVTQESFDRKDADGLVTAVVTRRIVVVAGHGDVFQRVQGMDSTTYSKNGQGITEYDWIRDTQNSKLAKYNK